MMMLNELSLPFKNPWKEFIGEGEITPFEKALLLIFPPEFDLVMQLRRL